VRPARYAGLQSGRPARVEIQFRPAAGGDFKTVRTVTVSDAYGYFDVHQAFTGSGTIRLRWADPRGPAIFSRSVSLTLK
jgi:hypothetical protein